MMMTVGNKLQFETISIELQTFLLLYKESLEEAIKQTIEFIKSRKIYIPRINNVICNTSPIYKELGINGTDELERTIREAFDKNSDSYNSEYAEQFIREMKTLLNECYQIDRNRATKNDFRNTVVDRFIGYGVLDERDKVELEYYINCGESEILELYEQGKLSEEDLYRIGIQKNVMEKIVKLKGNSKSTHLKIRKYMKFIPKVERIKMAVEGEIPYDYLAYADVTKQDLIMYLNGEMGVSIINNSNLPEDLKITSDDILDCYGRADETGRTIISGTRLHIYVYSGLIESKKVIDIMEKNKVLRIAGERDLFEDEEVSSYYSNDMLSAMFFAGEMDEEFVRKYKELSGERFDERAEELVTTIKEQIMNNPDIDEDEKEKLCQQKMLETYDLGICKPDILKQNLSTEYIEELYTDEKISDEYLLKLYKDGVVDNDVISQYFTDDELLKLYLDGKIPCDLLYQTKKQQEFGSQILEKALNGEVPIDDAVNMYLNSEIISIDDIDKLATQYDIDFSNYIKKGTSIDKIKELFEKYVIDFNLVSNLYASGIITTKQFNMLQNLFNKDQFYQLLQGANFNIMNTILASSNGRGSKSSSASNSLSNNVTSTDFTYEAAVIMSIFPDINIKEHETDNCGTIDAKRNTLNGYRVYMSQETGMVVFVKFESQNATYVMPYQEAAYFLQLGNNSSVASGVFNINNKTKTLLSNQSTLIKRVYHSKIFPDRFREACVSLSPIVAKKMNPQAQEYDASYCKEVSDAEIFYKVR